MTNNRTKAEKANVSRPMAHLTIGLPPVAHENPTAYARLILKRAGIAPLAAAIAVATLPTSSSGQPIRQGQATSLVQARATILPSSIRIDDGVVTHHNASGATDDAAPVPTSTSERVVPCGDRPAEGDDAPALRCVLRTTNLP